MGPVGLGIMPQLPATCGTLDLHADFAEEWLARKPSLPIHDMARHHEGLTGSCRDRAYGGRWRLSGTPRQPS